MTYVKRAIVLGRLKGMMEEADKKKALKQVAEASLNKNTLQLSTTKWRVNTVERARELVEQKAEGL